VTVFNNESLCFTIAPCTRSPCSLGSPDIDAIRHPRTGVWYRIGFIELTDNFLHPFPTVTVSTSGDLSGDIYLDPANDVGPGKRACPADVGTTTFPCGLF
jgi:hypothetical protein